MNLNLKNVIKQGKIVEARQQLVKEVKSSPSDTGSRTLFFQILLFFGEWDKALRHLDIIASQEPEKASDIQAYRSLIHGEKERAEVMRLKKTPSLMPETPAYFEDYYSGLHKLKENDPEGAKGFFEKAFNQRPSVSGTINNEIFEGFYDTDSFFLFFIEVFVYERYVWIPVEFIRELIINRPETMLDLIWIPARITTWEGLTARCYLPVRYPDSWENADERIIMGRMTDWTPMGEGFSKGAGQHVYQVGQKEISLLEIREAIFNLPDSKYSEKE